MSAHFVFELGFPPKSQASYFTGVVRCVRKKKTTYANLPCRMAVHSSEFRSQTCPNLINPQIVPHDQVSGKYVTLRWEKIYFDALEFSDGAKNLGCLATGQARARKKNVTKNIFSSRRKPILKI